MRSKNYIFLYSIICVWLIAGLYSCASTGNPSGGPRDTRVPRLDTLNSTLNKQLNFKPKRLVFLFDEFVEVKDPLKQVLTSPPLTYIPKITTRGKKVSFDFDEKEVLRENATYTINFGESIVDFTEGNKLKNFTFVFSTGDFLDSLNISGRIINAQTNEAEQEMVVFLYDNLDDSIVRKEKPFYFAKPDKDGYFKFENIKSDTFRIFAIKDENLNYKYDLESEKIAFTDSLIMLNDTLKSNLLLRASLPVPKFKIKSVNSKNYGKVNINCNRGPDPNIAYSISDTSVLHYKEIINDSINIYYHSNMVDSFFIYMEKDTFKVKPKGFEDFLKKSKFKKTFVNHGSYILPSDSLTLNFNYPIGNVDFEKIQVYDTIGVLEDVGYRLSSDHKALTFKYSWVAGEKYFISIDSGYIKSIYGHVLDSTGHTFSVLTKEKTGNLNINITNLDSTATYILKILKEKIQIAQLALFDVSEYELLLKGLAPEKYDIEIFEDKNKNNLWDAGDFDLKRQPEKYTFTKGEKLRENRDTELKIDFKASLQPKIEPKSEKQGLQGTTNPLQIKK